MPDSSDIDNALMAMLGADSTLLGYCTDGVHWNEAPPGSTKFVIVSLVEEHDEATFDQGRAIEDALYLAKAVMKEKGGGNIKAAAKRIDALLDDQPLQVGSPLADVSGYVWMAMFRESRIRFTEVDDADPKIRWQHRGGHYRCQMSVETSPVGSS